MKNVLAFKLKHIMMKKKRLVVLFTCSVLVLILMIAKNAELLQKNPILGATNEMDTSCYYKTTSSKRGSPTFDSITKFLAEHQTADGNNIFLHETSCFGSSGATLTCRQACAVESAAKMNPKKRVHLLFLSDSVPTNGTWHLIDQLSRYDNVRVSRIDVEEYVENTPIANWYAQGALLQSYWPRSHMSDILRYLTLWKFGGIYLDLDVVVVKALEDIQDFAGAEDDVYVAAGVISFSMSPLGRKIADLCLKDLIENFNGNVWGNNGPELITRVLQKICDVEYAKDMTPERCEGFKVLPPPIFYPVFYKNWKKYFKSENFSQTMSELSQARAIHVWNKMSSSEPVVVGSKVPYAVFAEKYCPTIYKNCGDIF